MAGRNGGNAEPGIGPVLEGALHDLGNGKVSFEEEEVVFDWLAGRQKQPSAADKIAGALISLDEYAGMIGYDEFFARLEGVDIVALEQQVRDTLDF